MTIAEYRSKLDQLDRLLNDPDVPMQPDLIWSLVEDVSRPEATRVDRPVALDLTRQQMSPGTAAPTLP